MRNKLLLALLLMASITACKPHDYSSDGTAGNNSTVTGKPDSANAGEVYYNKDKQHEDTVTHPQNLGDTTKATSKTPPRTRP